MGNTYKVYVQTNTDGFITALNSSAFLADPTGWTQIDEGIGDKFHHAQGNYFERPIMTETGIFRYKLVNGSPVEKTDAEISAELAKLPDQAPTEAEQMRADIDYIAAMSGVAL